MFDVCVAAFYLFYKMNNRKKFKYFWEFCHFGAYRIVGGI